MAPSRNGCLSRGATRPSPSRPRRSSASGGRATLRHRRSSLFRSSGRQATDAFSEKPSRFTVGGVTDPIGVPTAPGACRRRVRIVRSPFHFGAVGGTLRRAASIGSRRCSKVSTVRSERASGSTSRSRACSSMPELGRPGGGESPAPESSSPGPRASESAHSPGLSRRRSVARCLACAGDASDRSPVPFRRCRTATGRLAALFLAPNHVTSTAKWLRSDPDSRRSTRVARKPRR